MTEFNHSFDRYTPYTLVTTRHGIALANRHDIYIGQALIEYGEYCELETSFLQQLITGSGAIVEVGANVGSQTLALAARADVIAFEPQPFIFQNLCANLALNGISNVTAWPLACAAEPGSVWIPRQDYGRPGNFGGISVQTESLDTGIRVPSVRLDDMLDGHDIQLMKIDVEGFELQVLQGARKTLARCLPVLYVENDRVAQSPALIQFLWKHGYRLWWHISALFNPENFRRKSENRFPGLYAFNMLALPTEGHRPFPAANEITDAHAHPLRR
ncbi:FkbM family methyltransferase [Burkholderia ambifaria]|uniref:FkbM family methyltransferase n=1 Tax=Burkholderia ambifaria TaxID=152480 RepID=UPI001B8EF933|nr:FkbM family methyltransferase [Burkholderia ambifaria]MBR8334166.1 FkbM family methyltransferase [Burkholderia ambifaria]